MAEFSTSRLKLITMYIEKRKAEDDRATAATAAANARGTNAGTPLGGPTRVELGGGSETAAAGERRGAASAATRFTPIR